MASASLSASSLSDGDSTLEEKELANAFIECIYRHENTKNRMYKTMPIKAGTNSSCSGSRTFPILL